MNYKNKPTRTLSISTQVKEETRWKKCVIEKNLPAPDAISYSLLKSITNYFAPNPVKRSPMQ